MRIGYSSDLHGDLDVLKIHRDFSSDRKLNVYICSGDLIGQILDERDMEILDRASQMFIQIKTQRQIKKDIEEIADELSKSTNPKLPSEVKEIAGVYSKLHQGFKESSLKQYESIKKIFDSYEIPVLTIPGNWDTKNIDDFLPRNNLHNKFLEEVDGVKFAGYGCSAESMIGVMPVDLGLPFSEKELYNFLVRQDPDVALLHAPPYGICDLNGNNEHIGNMGALAYLLEEKPNVVLVGHNHRFKIEEKGDSVIINPGNFGRYYKDIAGTFVEFELNNDNGNDIPWIEVFHISDLNSGKNGVKKILGFERTKKGLELVENNLKSS